MSGRLTIVGTGPGNPAQTTPEALSAIAGATQFFGYGPYLDRLELRPDQQRIASDNRQELSRAKAALKAAAAGHDVCGERESTDWSHGRGENVDATLTRHGIGKRRESRRRG